MSRSEATARMRPSPGKRGRVPGSPLATRGASRGVLAGAAALLLAALSSGCTSDELFGSGNDASAAVTTPSGVQSGEVEIAYTLTAEDDTTTDVLISYSTDGTTFQGSFAANTGYRGFRDYGVAVRRTILDATLLARAQRAGARIREDIDVRDLVRDEHGRVAGVVAREGERSVTLHAPLVIGADGLRSIVARRAELGEHGRWPRRLALVRHFEGIRHDADVGEMQVFDGMYAGFAPVGGGLSG